MMASEILIFSHVLGTDIVNFTEKARTVNDIACAPSLYTPWVGPSRAIESVSAGYK